LTLQDNWLIQLECLAIGSRHKNGGKSSMKELSFIAMLDNGGRRLWADRRKKKIPIDGPDRRSGLDRRSGSDRRMLQVVDLDEEKERRKKFVGPTLDLKTDST